MDIREVARRGGLSRSERKIAAVRENLKKARAARQSATERKEQAPEGQAGK